ncbi:hypothetical protein KO519_04475 [Paraglaciecola agarilytica]|jgi:hypothetical protein|uniref:Uncharacterized protein n=1 Tax=Paraglaciecola chathamensis TaxID=368405 RepID=A0ABS0WBF3_9ALTE|nr:MULTISPECIES: hypothetical protein [Paraglaciecola]MBJ2135817.1 hypothetical protein [Paraglaciecola chathamensis]MBU3016955.1 hypothetical protein [Paraglaciecola agarilytica]MDO6557713.1 hypothetical protein [Paraglaciecola chathamensis]MDO6840860.1 hypothetical protein [Paraglaciecola chathamensis]|tara:strand:+ start:97 stop:480 length:384 start_codon:yes stop_codon:yes gene_type:complete
MASVHAISASKTSHFDSVSVFNQQRLQAIHNNVDKAKWSYLIANNIVFKQAYSHCIKLNMPATEQLVIWLEKLISGGQCANIFVEHVVLDEMSQARLTQLCIMHNVNLINVTTHQHGEVVKGPWLDS